MSGKQTILRGLFLNQINIIGLILLSSFFILRNPSSKWDKTISGDGKSYYAYLTSAIIYHDLDYRFVENYEAKYYPPDQSLFKEFRYQYKGETVNKTFPGITILWLPFFLIAHFLSYLFGFETDGYSILYQYSIGLAAIFYVWIGFRYLAALLKNLGFNKKIIVAVIIGLAFGTNLFYYTIHDPSLTHAYNFAILAGILYYVRQFYLEPKTKWLLIAVLLYGLAIIIRPTNIFMILFLPFALDSFNDFKVFLQSFFSHRKNIVSTLLVTIIIASYPVFWWYLQTGHWFVYSYGQEGFDFSNPHIYQILFSYEKGWLVYSPLIVLSIFGFIAYYHKSRQLFLIGLIGFFLLSYVFSSWWIWTYGASFGQRVFVDFYAVIGIFLAAGLQWLSKWRITTILWGVIAAFFIFLNLLQTYQFRNGILPTIGATKSSYWNSYFKLKAIHKTYPVSQLHEILAKYETDFETRSGWLTHQFKTSSQYQSGKYSQPINTKYPYSGGFNGDIPVGADFVQIKAYLYCSNNAADPFLVFDLKNESESIHYQSVGLLPYLTKNEWVLFYYHLPIDTFNANLLNVYFWNPEAYNIWVDDLEIIFGKYRTDFSNEK